MTISSGTRLGRYQILAQLGAGGMGDVYRARDPKLQRDVAIKVLPPIFAADPDRLARFEREAQLLASLTHGHIAHVYGVLDDPPALVMELVEGRTLDALVPSSGMAIRDALALAIQMADALAAAHAAGVVHRDFKPGNVVVTPDGTAKVLDFGLAKPFDSDVPATAETALAKPRTEAGLVMGTVAYMSPEQAAGRRVDARSDVFSFGSVLFEMVTGKRAFDRDTSMSTIAAIINEPAQPVSQVNAAIPRELERLIARCHRKDPARRVQSMADLRSALEELRDDLDAGKLSGPVSSPVVRPRSRALGYSGVAAAAAVLVAAGALAARLWWKPVAAPGATLYRLDSMTSDPGVTTDPAVTPSGDLLAYASDRRDGSNLDIWVQPTAGGEPVRVTTDPADDSEPTFSTDGSRIAFRSEREGGGIYVVPALGGSERLLVPLGRTPRFSPDGKWLMYSTGGRGSQRTLFIMPAAGGASQPLLPGYQSRAIPAWASDGGSIVFEGRKEGTAANANANAIWIVTVGERGPSAEPRDSGLMAVIRAAGLSIARMVAWRDGRLLFAASLGAGGALWSVSVDGGAATLRQVYSTTEELTGAVIAANGRIFFAAASTRASIASIAVDGARAISTTPVELTRSVAQDRWPSLSADGGTLAFQSTRHGGSIWVKDLASARETQLPAPGADFPVISPDGRHVAYARGPAISVVDTRGGIAREICQDCARYVSAWTPDAAYILGNTAANSARTQPVAIDAATGKVSPITTKGPAWFPRVSPNQRWVTFFEWPAPDRTREIVARYTPGGAAADERSWMAVTEGTSVDESAAWSADGRTLYFVSERDGFRCLYASRFDPDAGTVLGPPSPLLHMHGTRRTMIDTSGSPGRIDTAGGRLVFSLQEVAGNIWSLTPR